MKKDKLKFRLPTKEVKKPTKSTAPLVSQTGNNNNGLTKEAESKSPVKKLIIMCIVWFFIWVTAIFLLLNVFRPEWERIMLTVRTYSDQQWQAVQEEKNKAQITSSLAPSIKEIEVETEATTEGQLNVHFIEGLVQAILSASSEAKVATKAATKSPAR